MFHGMPVTVIGQQKGKNTKDNLKRNFGMRRRMDTARPCV